MRLVWWWWPASHRHRQVRSRRLDLARQRLDGEIVNADSMQLYRGNGHRNRVKLPPADRRGIAHHLLDVLDVTPAGHRRRPTSGTPRAAVEEIRARGRTPLLVGGSGLYIQSVVDEIDFPATDPAVRARLRGEIWTGVGPACMFDRLAERDPAAAMDRTRERPQDRPGPWR